MKLYPIFWLWLSLFGVVGYLINNTKGCLVGIAIWLFICIIVYLWDIFSQ